MRALRRRRIASLIAVSAAALMIGCGGDGDDDDVNNNAENYSGEEAEVAGLIDDFANAGRDGDGDLICEQIFSTSLAENVEKESGQSCASEVEENLPEGEYELEVNSVEVDGKAATVGVTDQDDNSNVLHIQKVGAEWRIARVSEGT